MNAPQRKTAPAIVKKLKLIRVGNSTGVILPKEVLERLNVALGDELTITQAPDGVTLSSRDDAFDAQMASARKIMKKYRNALRELAK
jgi:putative addiction module antidote